MSKLELKVLDREDFAIEMQVRVMAGSFSGEGAAWFDPRQVRESLNKLDAFPIPEGGVLVLAGGRWSDDGTVLVAPDVKVGVFKTGNKGGLQLDVLLQGEPSAESDGEITPMQLTGGVSITYQCLNELRLGLEKIVNGESNIFSL